MAFPTQPVIELLGLLHIELHHAGKHPHRGRFHRLVLATDGTATAEYDRVSIIFPAPRNLALWLAHLRSQQAPETTLPTIADDHSLIKRHTITFPDACGETALSSFAPAT